MYISIHTHIYITFVNLVKGLIILLIILSYVLQYLKNISGYLWNAFLSGKEQLPCFIILVYNWDGLSTKSICLRVHSNIGALKMQSHRIFVIEYCSTDKAYRQLRNKTVANQIQIYYLQLLYPNTRMLQGLPDVPVLVLVFLYRLLS